MASAHHRQTGISALTGASVALSLVAATQHAVFELQYAIHTGRKIRIMCDDDQTRALRNLY